MRNILVVCVGNICRSPVGERLLAQALGDGFKVHSAGIGALVGEPANAEMSSVAQERNLSLDGHIARQFDAELAKEADLILVMEPGHRRQIMRDHPAFGGKVMLFDAWTGAKGIADPYRMPLAAHEAAFAEIDAAARAWAQKLKK